MRRGYIVICSFFVAVLLLAGICYGSVQYSEKMAQEKKTHNKITQSQMTGNTKEQRTNSDTILITEIYHLETEEIVKEERSMPSEYAGLTREELDDYLKKCLPAMKERDTEVGLSDMKLVSFSKEEVVIRKIYTEPKQETGFFLKIIDGEIGVYNRSGTKLYEKTGVLETVIPKEEQEKLQKGYVVENEKELYSILENLSS